MAKVGLKETLALLAAGYKKKDIEALAAIDEDSQQEQPVDPAPEIKKDPDPATEQAQSKDPDPTPDYKQLYEDLLKQSQDKDEQIKAQDEKIKKIQKDNVNENVLPDMNKAREESEISLIEAIRSFY